jgi:ABC-2 type transport system ATP-binding protein
LIEACELRKSYGALKAVDGVSFEVARGEVFGLLGPNGAGKTTSMLMLAGLLRPDTGQVRINDRNFNPNDWATRSLLGWAPQHLAIYSELTVRENLRFFGRLYRLARERLAQRVTVALELAGLADLAARRASDLSGGEKRRLNLAAALVHEPQILILDEATTGLDPHTRRHVLAQVRELAQRGAAVVYASHYMDEVSVLCHRVALLDRGRVVECGPVSDLLARPGSAVEVRIEGPAPVLPVRIAEHAHLETEAGARTRIVLPRNGDRSSVALLTELLGVLERSGTAVVSVRLREPSLEDLFFERTGRKSEPRP